MSKYFFSASGIILAIGAIAFSTQQLNLGIDFESGTRIKVAPRRASGLRGGSHDARRRRDRRRRTTPRSRRSRTRVRRERLPGPGQDPRRPGAGRRPGARGRVRPRGRRAGHPDQRRSGPTFGEQIARSAVHRADLLADRHLGLRGDPVRGQVRRAGPDRPRPRHPDHGRHLRAGRSGGLERHRRRVPDDPRLLDVRHDHRLRPDPRERAADAARRLLADREPLDERGARRAR